MGVKRSWSPGIDFRQTGNRFLGCLKCKKIRTPDCLYKISCTITVSAKVRQRTDSPPLLSLALRFCVSCRKTLPRYAFGRTVYTCLALKGGDDLESVVDEPVHGEAGGHHVPCSAYTQLKGQCHEIFDFWFFS